MTAVQTKSEQRTDDGRRKKDERRNARVQVEEDRREGDRRTDADRQLTNS